MLVFESVLPDRALLRSLIVRVLSCCALLLCVTQTWAQTRFDPSFNANYLIDAFSIGGGNSASEGRKVAKLPNGDIVVAGRVRFNGDNFWNIGLVRYSPSGLRQNWTGTTSPFFFNGRNYVLFPNLANGGSAAKKITSIDDIQVTDGRIYVLYSREFSPGDRDVEMAVFNDDGTAFQNVTLISSTTDEVGKALDVKITSVGAKPVAVTVLAERNPQKIVVAKYNLLSATNAALPVAASCS